MTVNNPDPTIERPVAQAGDGESELPPGNHPLEIAARQGFGPLSPLVSTEWHGNSRPCVTCGQLTPRNTTFCEHCGQDLSPVMLEKMRLHAGPWYVLEHVRPFPGVSLERIVRQIARGLITETSIVRGPSTDHQWRFAVETPGLCRYFGRCWRCHGIVSPADTHCSTCSASLSFERHRATPQEKSQLHVTPSGSSDGSTNKNPRSAPSTLQPQPSVRPVSGVARGYVQTSDGNVGDLRQLSAAVDRIDLSASSSTWDKPPRIAGIRTAWLAVAMLTLVIVVLLWITRTRASKEAAESSLRTAPVLQVSQPPPSNPGG